MQARKNASNILIVIFFNDFILFELLFITHFVYHFNYAPNDEVEFYVTVNDELKTDFLTAVEKMKKKPFFDKDKPLLDNMAMKSLYDIFGKEEVAIGNWQETEINGNKAITLIAQIKWYHIKFEIYYKFGFIESKDKLYQIIVWTIFP